MPVPGQRLFECYMLSSKPVEHKPHASELAWSALCVWEQLQNLIFQALCPLTKKEVKVLRLTFDGLSAAQVAMEIGTSERNVIYYLSRAMKKLEVGSKIEAVKRVIWMGLI